VGEKEPNQYDLHDINGGGWEWGSDDFHIGYEGAPNDGSAWFDNPRGAYRIIRGGLERDLRFLGLRLVMHQGQQGKAVRNMAALQTGIGAV
jgi:formylglycine-generating enzyme required for sulfatase activity